MNSIKIWTDVSEGSLMGNFGWGELDPDSSTTEFIRLILKQVKDDYPEFSVIVYETDHKNLIEIESDNLRPGQEDEMIFAIQDRISLIWVDQRWMKN